MRPALADTDGPFMKFRNWAGQFYARDLDQSAQRYLPTETHDFVPVETASRKHGTDPFAKKD